MKWIDVKQELPPKFSTVVFWGGTQMVVPFSGFYSGGGRRPGNFWRYSPQSNVPFETVPTHFAHITPPAAPPTGETK